MEEQKNKRLVFAIGLPGSNKSKYLLSKYPSKYIVNVSRLRTSLVGKNNFSQEKTVWKEVEKSIRTLLEKYNIAFLDATNVNDKYREEFLSKFPDTEKIALLFYPNKEMLKPNTDIEKPSLEIPIKILKKMLGEFKSGYGKIWKEFDKIKKINFPEKKESIKENIK